MKTEHRHSGRGRQPVVFDRYLKIRVIRVRDIRHKNYSPPPKDWLPQCRPMPWSKDDARAVIDGRITFSDTEVRPCVRRSFRLLARAVRVFMTGDYFRASQLATKASELACDEYDFEIIDLARGFTLDTLGGHDDERQCQLWREQADWWAGGNWEGSGKLGAWMHNVLVPQLAGEREKNRILAHIVGLIDRRIAGITEESGNHTAN